MDRVFIKSWSIGLTYLQEQMRAASREAEQQYPINNKQLIVDEFADIPFRRLSLDPNSPDFHPSYMRVGLVIDGEERDDIQFYDVNSLEYMTTSHTSHLAKSIEPYWRYNESRQQRRARKSWERKHK